MQVLEKRNIGVKKYDLEDRTFIFAKNVRLLIKKLQKTRAKFEDGNQLIRSSGSVGANYIEANEALGKKDFLMRIKICRKEAKESNYWLHLIDTETDQTLNDERMKLLKEVQELENIFGAILRKATTSSQ